MSGADEEPEPTDELGEDTEAASGEKSLAQRLAQRRQEKAAAKDDARVGAAAVGDDDAEPADEMRSSIPEVIVLAVPAGELEVASAIYVQKVERGRQVRKRTLNLPESEVFTPIDSYPAKPELDAQAEPAANEPAADAEEAAKPAAKPDETKFPYKAAKGKRVEGEPTPQLASTNVSEKPAAKPTSGRGATPQPDSPGKTAAKAAAKERLPSRGRPKPAASKPARASSPFTSPNNSSRQPALGPKPLWLSEVEKVGIMNPALNRSKKDIITWVQKGFGHANFKEVRQFHTGAIFAQVIDRMFPGTVRLERVTFNPANENEIVKNWNVFQGGLARNQIERGFDVPKLMLPNAVILLLEAAQWLYLAMETQERAGLLPPYDPAARLAECKLKPLAASKK